MPAGQPNDELWMRMALAEARKALELDEVPVGAIVVRGDEVIGRGHNRPIAGHDPTAHAEIMALREAALASGNYRLVDCDAFSTVEPCAMCAGALIHARVRRLVIGADDPKAGAAGSVLAVINHPGLNHQIEVVRGVLGGECSELLQMFFRARRREGARRP